MEPLPDRAGRHVQRMLILSVIEKMKREMLSGDKARLNDFIDGKPLKGTLSCSKTKKDVAENDYDPKTGKRLSFLDRFFNAMDLWGDGLCVGLGYFVPGTEGFINQFQMEQRTFRSPSAYPD